ncbi:MAG: hypothetical protein LiPW31_314 [Microgenomates group bacterium LiPW_31]|nr:MAG: hypothetical protein LiPW31_314 [Microgenomates group bacterium LiPW_31]
MVTENQLIAKIRKLSQIKPRKDWVVLTKSQILGAVDVKHQPFYFPFFKPAFAGLVVVFILFGAFGYNSVKNSLPGDSLYVIRKVAHLGQAILTSETDKPAYQLKLANDRLEDLTISQAVKELSKVDAATSSPTVIKKIVQEAKKIEENKQKVESLGVVIDGTEELDDALGKIAGDLIVDLENRTLTEEKENILNKMRELFEQEKYSEALELYLINQ